MSHREVTTQPAAGGPSESGPPGPGRFTYDVRDDVWEWDDDVYTIHGYEPGEVQPTTDLIMGHKHRADRRRVEETFRSAMRTGEPFNMYYRILTRGTERKVMVVGEGLPGRDGDIRHLVGYYLDLTPEFDVETSEAADAAVEAASRSRATIEQAKGVLMLGYGLDGDAAFAMLRWWSRNRNLKVRDIAERLLTVARDGAFSHPGLRSMLDGLIHDLTTPKRPAVSRPTPIAFPGDTSASVEAPAPSRGDPQPRPDPATSA